MLGSLFAADTELPLLHTDLHSHLIPGIDDGVKTLDESLSLIRGMHALGYTHLITTPHIMSHRFPNTRDIILSGLDAVRNAVETEAIPVTLEASAEYYLDEHFMALIERDELLPFAGNHILFEMSYVVPPTHLDHTLFELQSAGYTVVLAHPERYLYYHQDFEKYEELRSRNVRFQVNINSLQGYYTRPVQKTAVKLMKMGMIDFLGSDLHSARHLETLQKSRKRSEYKKAFELNTILNNQLTA